MSFGISVEMIQAAYRELTRLPCLSMPRFGTVLDQDNVVVEMLTQCKLPKRAFMEKWQLQFAFQAQLCITGAVADPESLSAFYLLQTLVQRTLQQEATVVCNADQATIAAGTCTSMVVLLTKGILRDPVFAAILLAVLEYRADRDGHVQIVAVSADSGFEFPVDAFYEMLGCQGLGSTGLGA
ncbi:unnamed protein product [Polarella glacialis]|uniref:Uncharacterized protein n=1 Tax=Polarella glacialis TaxID=89957 RepID=A0A813DI60_POLGL|nr:unnamed protein product [Polarella glacialis]CAE8663541.1 unnamed protein product [Polarella glacialis]